MVSRDPLVTCQPLHFSKMMSHPKGIDVEDPRHALPSSLPFCSITHKDSVPKNIGHDTMKVTSLFLQSSRVTKERGILII